MNSWKLLQKVAIIFGIVSIVFTALAGYTNYELNHLLYMPTAPASLFEYNVILAILPFLFAVILSFLVAFYSSRAAKSAAEKETETQEKEKQQEKQPEPEEDVFTEST